MKNSANIYFIRHGESETNATKTLAGQRDVALTEKGEEQARALGAELAAKHFHVDAIIASDLKRARRTAEILAEALGYDDRIVTLSELREAYAGDYEGRPNREYHNASDADIVAAGGESREDFAERVTKADGLVRTYAHGTTIVVAHYGVYRMLRTLADGKTPDDVESAPDPANATLLKYPLIREVTVQ